ncbi:hypothetical protein [Methylomonas sp. DH-1]|uniref:hypothetical protein n=1 Tax=Methylomonas sp. (strain DH-1) TaxID=1727196 RepID=UPI0012F68800|nr:hypothetical protein [Methylomonas sp. DH-1]
MDLALEYRFFGTVSRRQLAPAWSTNLNLYSIEDFVTQNFPLCKRGIEGDLFKNLPQPLFVKEGSYPGAIRSNPGSGILAMTKSFERGRFIAR